MSARYHASGRNSDESRPPPRSPGTTGGEGEPRDGPKKLAGSATWRQGTGPYRLSPASLRFYSTTSRAPLGKPQLALTALTALALFGMTSAGHAAGGLGGEVDPGVYQLMVFVIAVFVGYYVVWGVTPALHTPLMSLTNAISSVIVVGALLAAGVGVAAAYSALAKMLGFFALAMVSVNIFGGFLVTQRMLGMYKRKKEAKK